MSIMRRAMSEFENRVSMRAIARKQRAGLAREGGVQSRRPS